MAKSSLASKRRLARPPTAIKAGTHQKAAFFVFVELGYFFVFPRCECAAFSAIRNDSSCQTRLITFYFGLWQSGRCLFLLWGAQVVKRLGMIARSLASLCSGRLRYTAN